MPAVMYYYLVVVIVMVDVRVIIANNWPCSQSDAIAAFNAKTIINEWPPFTKNPYNNQTTNSLSFINATLHNYVIVCALKYTDTTKKSYELRQFGSKSEAEKEGFIVTHQGKCGACSTTKDLAVYLAEPDLTDPVRKCGLKTLISSWWALKCLKAVGFSERCADIWLYNSQNTRNQCLVVCLKAWLTNQPNNLPDGSLNPCLQCDEDKSGPIFKFFAGRTRRDSGIHTAIHRPAAQVYNMTHCYF